MTLTAPAGAYGRHWNFVFLLALQQGNNGESSSRNTLFGGESSRCDMLHGELRDDITGGPPGCAVGRLPSIASKQKSFLVALTRHDERSAERRIE